MADEAGRAPAPSAESRSGKPEDPMFFEELDQMSVEA
jgi:hypothetical protein